MWRISSASLQAVLIVLPINSKTQKALHLQRFFDAQIFRDLFTACSFFNKMRFRKSLYNSAIAERRTNHEWEKKHER